jgi:hypothetical protein
MERLALVRATTVRRIPDVKDAVYANAMDSEREDQWVWMQRFERMSRTRILNLHPNGIRNPIEGDE